MVVSGSLIWPTINYNLELWHKPYKLGLLFEMEHIRTRSNIPGFPCIVKFAKIINKGINIRMWNKEEVLADAIMQYTQLAL